MRRGVSIAVVMVILTSILAPIAQAHSVSLPACCRADGKHHCNGMMETSGLTGFKSPLGACPYRQHAAVTTQVFALAATRHRICISVLGGDAISPAFLALGSSDLGDAHKRGPPTA